MDKYTIEIIKKIKEPKIVISSFIFKYFNKIVEIMLASIGKKIQI